MIASSSQNAAMKIIFFHSPSGVVDSSIHFHTGIFSG